MRTTVLCPLDWILKLLLAEFGGKVVYLKAVQPFEGESVFFKLKIYKIFDLAVLLKTLVSHEDVNRSGLHCDTHSALPFFSSVCHVVTVI